MIFTFADDREYYRVYMVNGDVKVRKGRFNTNGGFVPNDAPNTYLTKNPKKPLTLEYGKVYCESEEDIPTAIEMVKASHKQYVKNTAKRIIKTSGIDREDDCIDCDDELTPEMKDLMLRLAHGEILPTEFAIKMRQLEIDTEPYVYEFKVTETEFRLLRKGLTKLQNFNRWALQHGSGYRNISTPSMAEDIKTMKPALERLINAMDEVCKK